MIIKVTLSPTDVQNILLKHIETVCGLKPGMNEYLATSRIGDCPPVFEATVRVERYPPDARD